MTPLVPLETAAPRIRPVALIVPPAILICAPIDVPPLPSRQLMKILESFPPLAETHRPGSVTSLILWQTFENRAQLMPTGTEIALIPAILMASVMEPPLRIHPARLKMNVEQLLIRAFILRLLIPIAAPPPELQNPTNRPPLRHPVILSRPSHAMAPRPPRGTHDTAGRVQLYERGRLTAFLEVLAGNAYLLTSVLFPENT